MLPASGQGPLFHVNAPPYAAAHSRTKDPRILRAVEVLQRDVAAQIKVIASSFNLSTSRFRHLFKEEVGISPLRYVRLIRLERARMLFETSYLEVKEVVALVGAHDVSHFVREYKTQYSQTPTETRAKSMAR